MRMPFAATPSLARHDAAAAAPPRPFCSDPGRPGGGLVALAASVVLALAAGIPLRSAHLLLPDAQD